MNHNFKNKTFRYLGPGGENTHSNLIPDIHLEFLDVNINIKKNWNDCVVKHTALKMGAMKVSANSVF